MLAAEVQQSEQELEATRTEIQQTLDDLRKGTLLDKKEKSDEEKAMEWIADVRSDGAKAQEQAHNANVQVQQTEEKLAQAKQEASGAAQKQQEGKS